MSRFYYDEELATVYKISPVVATAVEKESEGSPATILVHANVKITNFRREKIRRTLSEVYQFGEYDLDTAKVEFEKRVLGKFIGQAAPISQDEYDKIKRRVEPAYTC